MKMKVATSNFRRQMQRPRQIWDGFNFTSTPNCCYGLIGRCTKMVENVHIISERDPGPDGRQIMYDCHRIHPNNPYQICLRGRDCKIPSHMHNMTRLIEAMERAGTPIPPYVDPTALTSFRQPQFPAPMPRTSIYASSAVTSPRPVVASPPTAMTAFRRPSLAHPIKMVRSWVWVPIRDTDCVAIKDADMFTCARPHDPPLRDMKSFTRVGTWMRDIINNPDTLIVGFTSPQVACVRAADFIIAANGVSSNTSCLLVEESLWPPSLMGPDRPGPMRRHDLLGVSSHVTTNFNTFFQYHPKVGELKNWATPPESINPIDAATTATRRVAEIGHLCAHDYVLIVVASLEVMKSILPALQYESITADTLAIWTELITIDGKQSLHLSDILKRTA